MVFPARYVENSLLQASEEALMQIEEDSSSDYVAEKSKPARDVSVSKIFQRSHRQLVKKIPVPERASALPRGRMMAAIEQSLAKAKKLKSPSKKVETLIEALNSYDREAPFSKKMYFSLFIELSSALMGQAQFSHAEKIIRSLILDADIKPGESYVSFLSESKFELKCALAECIIRQGGNLWEAKDILTCCMDSPKSQGMKFYRDLFSVYEQLGLRREVAVISSKALEKENLPLDLRGFLEEAIQALDNQPESSSSAAVSSAEGSLSSEIETPATYLKHIKHSRISQNKEALANKGIQIASSLQSEESALSELYFELSKSLFNQERYEEALDQLLYCMHYLSKVPNTRLEQESDFLKSKLLVVLNRPYQESEEAMRTAGGSVLTLERKAEYNLLLLESQVSNRMDTTFQVMKMRQAFSSLPWVQKLLSSILAGNASFAKQPFNNTETKRRDAPEGKRSDFVKKARHKR